MNNRPIKFRVWDKFKNKMSLVAQVQYCDDGYAKTIIVVPAPRDNNNYYSLVDGESGELMQFTGLLDRDGKDIYEGDILDMEPDCDGYGIAKIEWREAYSGSQFCAVRPDGELYSTFYGGMACVDRAKVIGNYFENPELIK